MMSSLDVRRRASHFLKLPKQALRAVEMRKNFVQAILFRAIPTRPPETFIVQLTCSNSTSRHLWVLVHNPVESLIDVSTRLLQ